MIKSHKMEICKRFVIDAGHRLYNHEGKCRSLHGHRYEFTIYCTAPDLDSLGRVIDFSVIKEKVGAWLNEYWDHAMLLWKDDPITYLWENNSLSDHKVFLLPDNPTIENLCSFLLHKAQSLLVVDDIGVSRVIGYETENCSAIAEK